MKNTLHIVISVVIIIASLISYLYTISPKTEGFVEEYYSLMELDNSVEYFEDGDIIYIYTSDPDIYEVHHINPRQTAFRKTPVTSYLITIDSEYEATSGTVVKAPDVNPHFDPNIEEVDGHRIIAEIVFKGDNYTFDTPASTRFIYSPQIATSITTSYEEYALIPITTGLFGFGYLLLVLVGIANKTTEDTYQQGYKKPQRGKRERY